jgi:hypothetical protein
MIYRPESHGLIRINLDQKSKEFGYPIPKYFDKILSKLVIDICDDFKVSLEHSNKIIFPEHNNSDTLTKLLKEYMNIEATSYNLVNCHSWGILVRMDDQVIVEYKLKYGE